MMVDLAEIQAAYYMVAATGVLVAAVYYILNIRAAERNRKIQLSTSITEKLGSKEFLRDFVELSNLDWRDPEAFAKKYDSSINSDISNENWAKRWHLWATYENLGYLLRNKLVDLEIVYNSQGVHPMIAWALCLPVLEYYRKKELGSRYFENFEYLARRMWEMGKMRGLTSPDFKGGLMADGLKDVFESKVSPYMPQ
jgi:hypothetical protein